MRMIDADALMSAAIDVEVNGVTISAVPAGIIRYAPTIDAIRAAGGCRCGACKWYEANGICGWTSTASTKNLRDEDDFCSDGEPKEAQEDG